MTKETTKTAEIKVIKCAIYTIKSTEEGLEQQFNSLDNQRLACESYVMSQAGEGWEFISKHYDDGGYSGGNVDRPGLQELFCAIKAGLVDCVVVYKIDRLTRS
jgi:site-specific DNA recombinase